MEIVTGIYLNLINLSFVSVDYLVIQNIQMANLKPNKIDEIRLIKIK